MKVMNVSGRMITVNSSDGGHSVGINKRINVKITLEEFMKVNPLLRLTEHFVVLDEDMDLMAVDMSKQNRPKEVVKDAPRLVIGETKTNMAGDFTVNLDNTLTNIDNMFTGGIGNGTINVNLNDLVDENITRTEAEWKVFLESQTKGNLRDFANVKEIEYPVKVNKIDMMQIVIDWLKDNNLVTV